MRAGFFSSQKDHPPGGPGPDPPPRGSQAGGPGMGFGPTRLKFLGKNIFGGKIHLDGPILGGSQGGPAPGWVGGPGS